MKLESCHLNHVIVKPENRFAHLLLCDHSGIFRVKTLKLGINCGSACAIFPVSSDSRGALPLQ